MSRSNSSGSQLKAAIAGGAIQVPGAPNALAALLSQHLGYPAVYLSGAALSAGVLGVPDVGLFSLSELAEQLRFLTSRVELPVIVDADTGFGGVANVERTVATLEAAGAAAIQLEDQQLPKRCGHLSGKSLISTDEMCAKLRAATAARQSPDTVILARTDARANEGIEGAIERAHRFVEAGADWIFPEAMVTAEEFAAVAAAVDVPLVANMTEFGKSPLLDFADLRDLGYRVVLYPVTLLRIAAKAMETALTLIATEGSQKQLLDVMQTRQELYDLIEYDDYQSRDREYFEFQRLAKDGQEEHA